MAYTLRKVLKNRRLSEKVQSADKIGKCFLGGVCYAQCAIHSSLITATLIKRILPEVFFLELRAGLAAC